MTQTEHDHPDGRSLVADARRAAIERRLRAAGSVTVSEIEAEFGVSPMTARRDLAELERRRVARRTHGGAVLPSAAAHEDSFASRLERSPVAKRALARHAAALVGEGESVFLDGSTSAYFVAGELLARALPVTLITNSLPIMDLVAEHAAPAVELIGVGGTLRPLTRSFVGPAATRAVGTHLADRLFFSTKGVSRAGLLSDPDEQEAELKRAMIARAQSAVLLVDRTKLEARGLHVVAGLGELSTVLGHGLGDADIEALAAAGPAVVRVNEREAA
jgi:DeoR/GlpR family transcriptional regulator of sugar metabolism